ncbi:unnamed protein product, partial [Ilex paraguariensis]
LRTQHFQKDASAMTKKIKLLEDHKRNLLGDDLESCSIDELEKIEDQLAQSLTDIKARKNQLLRQKIEKLKEEVEILAKENAELKKIEVQPLPPSVIRPEVHRRRISDVETELFIGPP